MKKTIVIILVIFTTLLIFAQEEEAVVKNSNVPGEINKWNLSFSTGLINVNHVVDATIRLWGFHSQIQIWLLDIRFHLKFGLWQSFIFL